MTTVTVFDLSAEVRRIIAERPDASTGEICRLIADAVPEPQLRDVLALALDRPVHVIRRTMGARAAAHIRDTDTSWPIPDLPQPQPQPRPRSHHSKHSPNGSEPNGSKWDYLHHSGAVLKWLRTPARFGTEYSEKRYGECNGDDVARMVAIRTSMARGNYTEARRWERFGKALVDHHVDTVAALPEAVIVEILRWAP